MKFVLVVTDTRGKNLAFVSRELQTLSLREATEAVRRGDVAGAYLVERKTGAYIRTKASVPKLEQFEKLSISSKRLFSYTNDARFDCIHLFNYLIQPKYNIFFASAFIRSLINEWSKKIDLTKRPEIIATLYHRGYVASHSDPGPDERGNQIAEEFHTLAKRWIQEL